MNPSSVPIHAQAYHHNIIVIKNRLPKTAKICAVVKADAYGHGLEALAPEAIQAGVSYLGITENQEAQVIRDLGIQFPLLRLRPALLEEVREAIPLQIEEIAGSYKSAVLISNAAKERNQTVSVHLKIDAGISRMGFHLPQQYEDLHQSISLPHLKIKGVMTHFPSADEDDAVTLEQEKRFVSLLDTLPINQSGLIVHTSNSAASLRLPERTHSMVRVGIASYGLRPSNSFILPSELQPVMNWKTRVVQVREVPKGSTIGYGMTYTTGWDSRIATLPIGYANGYLRTLSNNADVLIHGRRCPVVGRVSMNLVTVDVTDLNHVQIGDECVLVGRQGDETVTLDELAERAGTISYEMACLIGMCNKLGRIVI